MKRSWIAVETKLVYEHTSSLGIEGPERWFQSLNFYFGFAIDKIVRNGAVHDIIRSNNSECLHHIAFMYLLGVTVVYK